jgi:hypothetical protein
MHRHALTFALLAVVALAGCEAVSRLQNDKVLAGVLLQTPSVQFDNNTTVPGAVTAQVFFGEIPGGVGGSGDVQPITGATVTLEFTSGGAQTIPLAEVGGGEYQTTSVDDASLVYTAGVEYTFKVVHAGETYTGKVTAPQKAEAYPSSGATPPAPGAAPLPTPPTPFSVAASALSPSYPVCRTTTDPAVVSVLRVTTSGSVGSPCFAPESPTTPAGALALLFQRSQYTAACIDVPSTCFPSASDNTTAGYVVGLTALADSVGTSGGLSSNLFLSSGVFAGTMDAAVMTVAP